MGKNQLSRHKELLMNHNKTIVIFWSAALMLAAIGPCPCFALDFSSHEEFFKLESDKKISLDFTNANLNDVLKIFSQQSGLNFIAATDVATKKVNLYLENVPVEEALERILSANNLTYEIKPGSNIFVVNDLKIPDKQLMTRVYPLKYAAVTASKLNITLSIELGSEEKQDSVNQNAEATGIKAAIEHILTQDGSVTEDPRTNSLIVTDIPSQFSLIEQTIARLDVRVPQILIEAEMLDISKTSTDLLGAKFGDTPLTFNGAKRDTLYPFNRNKAMRDDGKIGGQGFSFSDPEYRVGTISFSGLTVVLQFLRTQTDTRNLARPRILTLNNDTAEISISTDEAIGLQSTTSSSEGTATSVAEAERVQTGVFLKVTPQANVQTREITMAIEPKVIQARSGGTFGGQTFNDPEERGSKSILRINDGDTIVLGGLLRTNFDQTKTRVPVVEKIPLLGAAFRHKNKVESQRELIIFITPHIVEESLAGNIKAPETSNTAREQSVPTDRRAAIEKELSSVEEKRFNSYK
jgi:type II secretory pathway component GspD/PulD (secretin)